MSGKRICRSSWDYSSPCCSQSCSGSPAKLRVRVPPPELSSSFSLVTWRDQRGRVFSTVYLAAELTVFEGRDGDLVEMPDRRPGGGRGAVSGGGRSRSSVTESSAGRSGRPPLSLPVGQGVAVMPTMGLLSFIPPVDPKKPASPKLNPPPSAAARSEPC